MKQRTLKTFTFAYRGGYITYNREDGYVAWLDGNSLGGADSKQEAEALIDEARREHTYRLMEAA